MYQTNIVNIDSIQNRLQTLQQQASTGIKVASPADDPIAATQIIQLNAAINSAESYKQNMGELNSALSYQEGVISSVVRLIQVLQQTQVQAGNGVLNQSDRETLAQQVQSNLDQLVSLANSMDQTASGYLFSGSMSNVAPFSLNGGVYTYNGDSLKRYQKISDTLSVAENQTGDSLFCGIPAGNGDFSITQKANPNNGSLEASTGLVFDRAFYVPDSYTVSYDAASENITITGASSGAVYTGAYVSGSPIEFNGISITLTGSAADAQTFSITSNAKTSLFDIAQNMIANLQSQSSTDSGRAAIHTQNAQLLPELKTLLDRVISAEANIGNSMNTINNTALFQDSVLLNAQKAVSNLQAADLTRTISELSLNMTSLEVAQKTFVSIQGLSLFNYI
jgi:flagellar hook-associated protein 3 FlgL